MFKRIDSYIHQSHDDYSESSSEDDSEAPTYLPPSIQKTNETNQNQVEPKVINKDTSDRNTQKVSIEKEDSDSGIGSESDVDDTLLDCIDENFNEENVAELDDDTLIKLYLALEKKSLTAQQDIVTKTKEKLTDDVPRRKKKVEVVKAEVEVSEEEQSSGELPLVNLNVIKRKRHKVMKGKGRNENNAKEYQPMQSKKRKRQSSGKSGPPRKRRKRQNGSKK